MNYSENSLKNSNTSSAKPINSNVAAIITCFHPKTTEILTLLSSVLNQATWVIIINNGGLDKSILPSDSKIILLDAPSNLGTAGGYNFGAKKAWELGASHLLLLDQDSDCDAKMLEELLLLENELLSQNKKVAVVGPYYVCKSNSLPAPFIQHQGFRIVRIFDNSEQKIYFKNNKSYIPCSYVISSGSLISKSAWETIGQKNEGLFLDFTDIEWGLRAAKFGYQCYGSFDAKMFHIIGDEQLNLMGRKISLHSPLRHYYAFRNCVWIFKQTYIPLATRVNYLMKLAPKLLIYSFFSDAPWKQIKFMLLGISDGLFNKMGIYSE